MGTGRPTKLTRKRAGLIAEALRQGFPFELAAAMGGVTRMTLYNWRRRGERALEVAAQAGMAVHKREAPFAELAFSIQRALAEWELKQIQAIAEAGKRDWRAAAWLLERRYPDEYGPPGRLRQRFTSAR
jgi:hypothetical protein